MISLILKELIRPKENKGHFKSTNDYYGHIND